MYPIIPTEAMHGALEMFCCFCTMLVATLTFLLHRAG